MVLHHLLKVLILVETKQLQHQLEVLNHHLVTHLHQAQALKVIMDHLHHLKVLPIEETKLALLEAHILAHLVSLLQHRALTMEVQDLVHQLLPVHTQDLQLLPQPVLTLELPVNQLHLKVLTMEDVNQAPNPLLHLQHLQLHKVPTMEEDSQALLHLQLVTLILVHLNKLHQVVL